MAPGRARSVVVAVALALGAVVLCGSGAAYGAVRAAGPSTLPSAGPPSTVAVVPAPVVPTPRPDVFTTGVRVSRDGEDGLWLAWSLLERDTDRRVGSANATTERTNSESAIKAWIAADTLRDAHEDRRAVTATERDLIRRAVRSSDDDAAEGLYRRLGGDASLTHLRQTCGVAVSTEQRGYWALTQITAVDATRTLDCVLRLAPRWPGGAELIGDLRSIDDDGRSGIAALLPGERVAEKNGWTYHSATGWNVNCVVASDDYALSVLTRFPGDRPEEFGWQVCRDVADDVLSATRDV
ncbi:hypothetical protein [Pseudonocardia endophytica]|uniref:Beta-lactamase family protein n=1 Tax=Pseudonocardia endophytica TaxID=401976 RepID=A0A4R1HUY2_PSEEN|nr:hypothetical protein [Pseudonocardia endophytica]TCK24785.1 hypothetical protein EV378_0578 [Pseudonocardia endophytica]